MPGHSSTVTPFASDLLTNTEWDNLSDGIIDVLFPNFFIVYFGQNFPKGDISLDNIKLNFAKLGAGYSLWISAAAEAIKRKDDTVKFLAQQLRTPATPKQTSSSPTSSPITTHPNPYRLPLDHTASSPSLIQTSSQ
jgi:hypothetical protein